ncbi:immunoglobulin-like domain-containing protein [Paenibacillus shenyangensis]|uniref:immunoglobulin-like domain-containing protein n=1 Tax=Paenibacillus sp. A9 TaxID=1284352 RepID=UPI0003805764|nr:immunoglobulin-like domain-containing protein [Paenibacillus sp. A9]
MKKFISTCLAFSLVMPGVTGNAAFAAESTPTDVPNAIPFKITPETSVSPTNVHNNVYEMTSVPTSASSNTYQLESINILTPLGMAYYNGYVYITQGNNGLSKIDVATQTVTKVVYGSPTSPMHTITADTDGTLYYVVPDKLNNEYSYIKKIKPSSLNQTLTTEQFLAASVDYAHIPASHISSIAMDKNNQLYISLDKGWDLDPGLLRWSNTSKTLTPVSEEASMITAITFDNQGNLYFKTPSPQSYYSYAAGIVKISAADLKGTLPVADEKLISYKQDVLRNEPYNGLLFLSDGTSYFSNGQSLKRVYPESRPIVTLKGYSDAVVQGDIYTDPGIRVIEDEKYSKFDIKVTYSFNGEFVPSLDTSKVGTYTIHYVAVNPAGTASLEKTREVTVKPTPSQLTDWYITGINSMDADSQNLYLTNYSYKDNPNYGLYKISLQTMQKTRLAAINDIGAVAVNASGDLFFTRYDMDNMIFKIEAKHLQSGKALTADQLMKLSRTYMPFTAKEASAAPLKINGLEFDKQGRLYAAVNVYGKTSVTSKIVRLTGNDWNKSTLVTELPVSSNDMDFSPAGDLYISTQELYTTWKKDTYKVTLQQLNTLPVLSDSLTKTPYTEGDKGIAFLADGTGYVSRTDDFEKRKQTILKFNY